MSIHSAKELSLQVASVSAPHDKQPLQPIFLRRFTLRMEDEPAHSYAENPWQKRSTITQQSSLIEAEMAYTETAAAQLIRAAAFQAQGVKLYVQFPDGTSAAGTYNIADYEVYADAGEALRIAFTAHSSDALLLDIG